MPIYCFECVECHERYEDLCRWDETGAYPDTTCPKCGSAKKDMIPSFRGAVVFTNPRGTSKADNFSYVAGYNMAQAQDERRRAEEKSHMGSMPYNEINDASDEHFDFSKI